MGNLKLRTPIYSLVVLAAISGVAYWRGHAARITEASTFTEASINGREGFRLTLPPKVWQALANQNSAGPLMLSSDVYESIDALVEAGIGVRRMTTCSKHWLVVQINKAAGGNVLLDGICATAEEIKAAGHDSENSI